MECKMIRTHRIFSIVVLMFINAGCASITRGTTESFVIETVPTGATAQLSNGLSCDTPCSLKVKRRGDFLVTITKDGYETVSATVTSSVDSTGSAGMAGNVLLGGFIGAGVDAGTGAMHSHKPNPLKVTMQQEKATTSLSKQSTENDSSSDSNNPFEIQIK